MNNEELVRSMYDAFNRRDLDHLAERCDEDTEVTLVAFSQVFSGPEGFRQFAGGFIEAFPDIHIEPITVFSGGNQLAAEFRARGTHGGTLRSPAGDIPPTGNSIDYSVAEIWELEAGKVRRLRNYTDSGTLMRQLGLV
jgi:steroid delta-isomerase-like uncharacterized protein